MRIIFSRDRAAQLDLLTQSLDMNADPEGTEILWYASSEPFLQGYKCYAKEWDLPFHTPRRGFNDTLRRMLRYCADETVTFFCDDDVLYRPSRSAAPLLLRNDEILTFSLRLQGDNSPWAWQYLPRTDHGYPGSIDGHVFRHNDVVRMIGGDYIENPTQLETILALRCDMLAEERPLMLAFREQRLVGIPVNRVSPDSGCPFGEQHPQTTKELNARYLAGERIDFQALDFSGVKGCHHEIPFVWRDA